MTDKLFKYIQKHAPEVPASFAGPPSAWWKDWLRYQAQLGKIPKKLQEEVAEYTYEQKDESKLEYSEPQYKVFRHMIPGSDGMGNIPVYEEITLDEQGMGW